MLLNQKKTNVAYRCPRCGSAVVGMAGSFALSAAMIKLKCPCGQSELTMAYTNDKKIRLDVPCLFCGTKHNYLLSQNVFFGRDLFLINCAYTNFDIGFIGTEENLNREIERSDAELNEVLNEVGVTSLDQLSRPESEPELPDAHIYDIVRFLIRELEADGQIDCPCHNGEYEVEMRPEGIRVFCLNCGGEYLFSADSVSAAQDFLNCDHLKLTDPSGRP